MSELKIAMDNLPLEASRPPAELQQSVDLLNPNYS